MVKKKVSGDGKLPNETKIFLGGLAGMMSTSLFHPLDVVKVRMQQDPRRLTSLNAYRQVARCEGFKSLYSGLSAGLLRQASYTTMRLGVFYWLFEEHRKKHGGKNPSLEDKVWMGVYAGLAGAVVGCPTEVVLVRMMADGRRDMYNSHWRCCPRPYLGVIDGLSKLCVREGICGFWRGGTLTLGRSAILSAVQIISYEQIREKLREQKAAKGLTLSVLTSLMSSFVAAFFTLPIDVVKTRYQVLEPGASQANVWSALMKERGISGFWRGFTPYCTRLFLHTMVTYTILDQLVKLYHEFETRQEQKK